jgi:hypothetical protein
MTTNEILNLKSTEAAKAFLDAYYENEAKDIMNEVCKRLDEKYEPQHTFDAKEFDLDEDLKVTYAMFNEVDDPACIIACTLESVNFESDNCDIDEDETLAEYIEHRLDDRMSELPTYKEQIDSCANAYGPERFLNK